MNAQAFGPHATIRAAVRAAESLCTLPAVPTQDWCERAARALASMRPPSIALVMFARVAEGGEVARVEAAGVWGCTLAEVSTTFGRIQSVSSIVPLGSTHPALGSVRSGAHTCTALGWTPASAAGGSGGVDVFVGGEIGRAASGTPMHARWGESGAADYVVGAARLTPGTPGCYVVAEIGLTAPGAVAGAEDAALLAEVLPLLARRASVAFGAGPFTESACLTHREEVVLEHLLYGKSVRLIAAELGRSPHTVHDHVKSLHRKLNASSRGALVARALGHLPPPGAGEPVRAGSGSTAVAVPSGNGDAVPSR